MYDCRIIGSNLGASICFFECSSWEPCWPFCEPYLSVSNSSRGWTYSNAFGYCTEDDDVEMAFLFSPLQELGILCWVSRVEMESSEEHFSWTTQNGDLGISAMSFYFYQDFTCATLDQPGTVTSVHCKHIFMAVQSTLFHALGQKLPGLALTRSWQNPLKSISGYAKGVGWTAMLFGYGKIIITCICNVRSLWVYQIWWIW